MPEDPDVEGEFVPDAALGAPVTVENTTTVAEGEGNWGVTVGWEEGECAVSKEVLLEDEEGAVPDPPAASDSWAKPIEAGVMRNTEYTFFCNVV